LVQVAAPPDTDGQGAHEPQCRTSLEGLTQLPLQSSGSVVGQRSLQPYFPSLPSAHTGRVASQARPQVPQLAGSLRSVSQPGAVLQSPNPARQAPPSAHRPPTQATLARSTLGSAAQSLSQPPQWRGSSASRAGLQGGGARSGAVDDAMSSSANGPRRFGLRVVQPARQATSRNRRAIRDEE
jgi:hypothetical protein